MKRYTSFKTWQEFAEKIFPSCNVTETVKYHIEKKRESYLLGVDNFNHAAITAIEKEIEESKTHKAHTEMHDYNISGLQLAIDILKELKPNTEK